MMEGYLPEHLMRGFLGMRR